MEQLQKGSGRKRGSGSDSGSDGEGLAAPRVRVEAGALWKLYRSEQQRRTLAEDESDVRGGMHRGRRGSSACESAGVCWC